MSSVHDGVSCDGCMAPNFSGDRYKCLRCYDFDLCARCYAEERANLHANVNTSSSSRNNSETLRDISRQNLRMRDSNDEHSPTHPMQCIMTQQDFELTYQGDQSHQWDKWRVVIFTCPVCGQQGFSRARLVAHVIEEHSQPSSTQQQHEMACPICISTDFYRVGFGDYMPNQLTDMVSHMQEHHTQTTLTSGGGSSSSSGLRGSSGGARVGMSTTRADLARGVGNHRAFTIGGGRGLSEFLRSGMGMGLAGPAAGALRAELRSGNELRRAQVSLLTSTANNNPSGGTSNSSPPSPSRLLLNQQRNLSTNQQHRTNPNRTTQDYAPSQATTTTNRRFNGASLRASSNSSGTSSSSMAQRTAAAGFLQQQQHNISAFGLDFPLYLDSELDHIDGPPPSMSNNSENNNRNANESTNPTTVSREAIGLHNNNNSNNNNTTNDNHRSGSNNAAGNGSTTHNRGNPTARTVSNNSSDRRAITTRDSTSSRRETNSVRSNLSSSSNSEHSSASSSSASSGATTHRCGNPSGNGGEHGVQQHQGSSSRAVASSGNTTAGSNPNSERNAANGEDKERRHNNAEGGGGGGVIVMNSVGRAVLRLTPSLHLLSSSSSLAQGQADNRAEAAAASANHALSSSVESDRTEVAVAATATIRDEEATAPAAQPPSPAAAGISQGEQVSAHQQTSKASHVQAIWPVLMAGRTCAPLPEVCLQQCDLMKSGDDAKETTIDNSSGTVTTTLTVTLNNRKEAEEREPTQTQAVVAAAAAQLDESETEGDEEGECDEWRVLPPLRLVMRVGRARQNAYMKCREAREALSQIQQPPPAAAAANRRQTNFAPLMGREDGQSSSAIAGTGYNVGSEERLATLRAATQLENVTGGQSSLFSGAGAGAGLRHRHRQQPVLNTSLETDSNSLEEWLSNRHRRTTRLAAAAAATAAAGNGSSSAFVDTSMPSFLLRYARRYQRNQTGLFQEAGATAESQQQANSRNRISNRNQSIVPSSQPVATTATQDQRGVSTTNSIQMVPVSRAIEIIRRLDARNSHNISHRLSPSDSHSNSSQTNSTAIDYLSLLRRSEAALHSVAGGGGSTPRGGSTQSSSRGVTQSNRSATSLTRRQSVNIHQQGRVSKSKSGTTEEGIAAAAATAGQRDGTSRNGDLNEFFENAFKVPDLEVLLDGEVIERPRLFEPFHVRSQEDRERYFEPWLREEELRDTEAAQQFLYEQFDEALGTDLSKAKEEVKRRGTQDSSEHSDNGDDSDYSNRGDLDTEEELKLCDEEVLLDETACDSDNDKSTYDFQRSHHVVIGPVDGTLNGRDDTESNYWSDYRFLHNRRDRCVAYEQSESMLGGCYDWRFARQLVLGAWDAPISLYLRSHYQADMFARVLKTNLRELMQLKCKERQQQNENAKHQQDDGDRVVDDLDRLHRTGDVKSEAAGDEVHPIEVHPDLWFLLDLAAFVEIV